MSFMNDGWRHLAIFTECSREVDNHGIRAISVPLGYALPCSTNWQPKAEVDTLFVTESLTKGNPTPQGPNLIEGLSVLLEVIFCLPGYLGMM
jgi:hypothetical protein